MIVRKCEDGKRYDAELSDLGPMVYLAPCPFCGEQELELAHTWTESYWIECLTCGAEVHGTWGRGGKGTRAGHIRAAKSAVEAWNMRNGKRNG